MNKKKRPRVIGGEERYFGEIFLEFARKVCFKILVKNKKRV